MAKIGIVPMSAKPYHAGHDGLIRLAAKENDEVHLYVSTSDRDEVSGQAMAKIWKDQIEHTLPGNVKVEYGGSPVLKAFQDIGKASEANSPDAYSIYSDPEDAAINFSDDKLQKYAANLHAAGRVKTRPVERTSTVDVSGTKMRGFLANGDKKSFLKFLPPGLDGEAVWNTLTTVKPEAKGKDKKGTGKLAPARTAATKAPAKKGTKKPLKGEALLRGYVRTVLGG
jgi:hypothetical protein